MRHGALASGTVALEDAFRMSALFDEGRRTARHYVASIISYWAFGGCRWVIGTVRMLCNCNTSYVYAL